jgi:dienelactone hydrolase
MMRQLVLTGVLVLTAAHASAQQAAPAWEFAFPQPAPEAISVTRDLAYATAGADSLRMDVYRPASGAAAAPALIFFNAGRSHPFYTAWAQHAASRGLVAVLPDIRPDHFEQDFNLLLAHLRQRGAESSVNIDKLAVYAGSGIVSRALPLVQKPGQTAVRAAVMYYGSAQVPDYRLDLPVLFVRAGLDRPDLNRAITAMASQAITQNAPFTLLNHASGYHAFETANDDDATRAVIERTIEFVKRATAPGHQAAVRSGALEARAAGQVLTGHFGAAATTYAELVKARPGDARMRLAYGEALLGDGQYATACAEFDALRNRNLGYRDLGLPAARACMLKGDPDAAIAWLRSIPLRFLPTAVAEEEVFAPIRDRADFKAVFQAR